MGGVQKSPEQGGGAGLSICCLELWEEDPAAEEALGGRFVICHADSGADRFGE